MNEVLRAHVMPPELVALSAEVRRGHWSGPAKDADNFGLYWRPDDDGCTWTRAHCEWRD